MKKYVVNKNLQVGKHIYKKDDSIAEGDPGFADLLNAGHVTINVVRGEGEPINETVIDMAEVAVAPPKVEAPVSAPSKAKGRGRKG